MLLAKDSKISTSLEPKSVNRTISLDSAVHIRPSFILISSKISSPILLSREYLGFFQINLSFFYIPARILCIKMSVIS
jgi:hypothetical protein